MSSEMLHEAAEKLLPATIDRHRATVSLMEELEAVDWYDQRIDAATDPALRAILRHNRDEEKEHAAMVLEWLRRQDPALDEQLRTYLFKEGDILGVEAAAEGQEKTAGGTDSAGVSDGCLGIGDLRGEETAP
jgi:ferritin-like protein